MKRIKVPARTLAEVVTASRRRCCICFALDGDSTEKPGQIAHLDRDASNSRPDNLAFLCLKHHDQYDSRTSQSKGLTLEEVKGYRGQLAAFVADTLPQSDADIAAALVRAIDRPAFRTPFRQESSLQRFKEAIGEAIDTINTGRTPQGDHVPSKARIGDPALRAKLDALVERLVALRSRFDQLTRAGEIGPCGCGKADCPTFMLSDRAAQQMDSARLQLLEVARAIGPEAPRHFYDV
jgi:hypothetical protein